MTTNNRVATELAKAHLVVAGIALLGWIAMALLANSQQLPQHWPQESEVISDVAFGGILLCGPAFLAAGIGLLKRRPWARLVAMGLGGVAGVLAVAGVALACFGVVTIRAADVGLFGLFAGYCGAVFVMLWNENFSTGDLETGAGDADYFPGPGGGACRDQSG